MLELKQKISRYLLIHLKFIVIDSLYFNINTIKLYFPKLEKTQWKK